jgi:hypothetical protein
MHVSLLSCFSSAPFHERIAFIGWLLGGAGLKIDGHCPFLASFNRLLASAGQNLDDVFKYLESEDRLGMARAMIQWRHIAPTCPDTLCALPLHYASFSIS